MKHCGITTQPATANFNLNHQTKKQPIPPQPNKKPVINAISMRYKQKQQADQERRRINLFVYTGRDLAKQLSVWRKC
jgi:hypothetical protein